MCLLCLREKDTSDRWPLHRLEFPDISSSRLAKGVPFDFANLSAAVDFMRGSFYNLSWKTCPIVKV